MVKDDSLYIIAIVAVVAVVGLVIMATGSSSTVMVAEDLPSMVEDSDSTAIAGQAFRTGSSKLYDRGYGFNDAEVGFNDAEVLVQYLKSLSAEEQNAVLLAAGLYCPDTR